MRIRRAIIVTALAVAGVAGMAGSAMASVAWNAPAAGHSVSAITYHFE